MKKRILSMVLALAILCSMLPMAAADGFVKTKEWNDGLFTDVSAGDWFYENVKSAYELGLMVGHEDGRFEPAGRITIAQTIAVAARVHAIAAGSGETFAQGSPWYQVYVDYAKANGIVTGEAADYNKAATRLEFARILAKAMSDEDLQPINDVEYGDIPDVAEDEAVYQLYRAGVLMGNDAAGTFAPDSTIQRSEMAAIVTRMALPELRIEQEAETAPAHPGNLVVKPGGGSGEEPEQPAPEEDVKVTVEVENVDGKVNSEVSLEGETVKATVPAGVALEEGAKELTLTIDALDQTGSDVTAGEDEALTSYDVHIAGVSADNTVVITVAMGEILSKGLNMGNIALYHVEDGVTNPMTQVATLAELDAHNEFYYDPATGEVTVAMASFSEITVVAGESKWEGKVDHSWYDASKTELTIANADQLWSFSQIVGGMAQGIEQDCFAIENDDGTVTRKSIKLISDVNLADDEANNVADKIFYPIGYYNSTGSYEKVSGGSVSSSVSSFEGIFDGNGHTIRNFYQNTWEMFGDYNDGYSGTPNHYKDAMGLFGYVVNGTVKNLTVENFKSDGEFTPTGVIAAYACNSTFENIAIVDCNPRVYNTGNGGIVGIGGNSDDPDTYNLTFTNITVDNTNKITALWGSWDVACGGLVGMFRGTGHVYMTNCHVAAQMDVYNDVCGNYQYYWYRYSGMLVGTNKNMTTDANGYTVPETDKYHAENCTVHFGDWNDYYYCELVANTKASYTHDHQFSRLTEVDSVDVANMTVTVDGATTAIPASGRFNYVVVNGTSSTENATCYHFVDGAVWNHADAGEETVDVDGDGVTETVLKEDRQHYYLPFNQLFTGYGWGVKHIPIHKGTNLKDTYPNLDITILDREEPDSEVKFNKAATAKASYTRGTTVTIGELFVERQTEDAKLTIQEGKVQVFVSPVGNSNVSGVYVADTTNWENGTLTFYGSGPATVTITDYYYCTPTTLNIEIDDGQLYRVGNQNAVTKNQLTKLLLGKTSDSIEVVRYLTNAEGEWTEEGSNITFKDTGVVELKIDGKLCYLEVVDAANVTGLSGTISGSVVLLNDCGLSSLTVSGRNTVYGNGFTATYTGNGQYLNNGLRLGVVNVSENGTLDNLRIKASIYPEYYLYYSDAQGGVSDGNSRYYYQLSAVAAKDNATISNCYIYGGRNNIFVNTGDVIIKDTILECGTVANVQIQSNSSHTVTFENVTTIQHQVNPTTYTLEKEKDYVMLGAGIVVGPETNDNPTIVLNGSFKQYNWVTDADKNAVSNKYAKQVIAAALGATAFNHTINGNTASNTGIIYLNNYPVSLSNKTGLPYVMDNEVSISTGVGGTSISGQVYSLQEATSKQINSDWNNADRTTVNGLYQPQFKYTADLGGQHIEKTDDGDEHCYRESDTIHVMFPAGNTKELDLAALVDITKYTGQDLGQTITCKNSNGDQVAVTNGKVSLTDADTYTVTYTVTDELFYDKDGNPVEDTKTYSWDVAVSVSLKDKAVPDAYFAFDATKQKMGYYKPTIGDVKQYLPFLAGLKIYDYDYNQPNVPYLRFNGDDTEMGFKKVASITITEYKSNEAYIEVKLTDGGVINTKFLARADSSGGSTYTGKIKTSGNTIYFVNDGGTSNSSATTTSAYWYVDYYKFTGNNGVAIQSAQQTFNSTGGSSSTPSGSFGTTINYTVTYDANEGKCGQTVGYATSACPAVTLPRPARSGYVFAGWYTAASGGERIGGAGGSYTPSANITLYAQWDKPCTVTYNANGGSVNPASEKYDGATLSLPAPTRDGYWFIGWYDAATGGNKIGDAGATYNPSGDITLYAHWQEQVEYTVTYNANGGTCGTASATYQGTPLTLPTPTRTGYTFNGWYTAASGGDKIEGATYTPSANITLYAQWTEVSYKITYNNSNTSSVNGPETAQYGDTVTVTVVYSKGEDSAPTVKGDSGEVTVNSSGSGTNYTYTFTMPAEDVTMTITGSACITADTLITLADGSQVRVDSLTGSEELLVWNLQTGMLDTAPILFVDSDPETEYEIVHLYFSDGTDVKVIYEHGFWDYDLNKYVYLDRFAEQYIGHTFAKQNGAELEKVQLVDVVLETEYTSAWSPVTAEHLCYFVNGMLSMPGGIDGLFNIFDVDPETMTYDYAAMEQDIETYGLFTYEELNAIEPLSREMFEAAGGAYLKVSIGKGNLTMDELRYMIRRYSVHFN